MRRPQKARVWFLISIAPAGAACVFGVTWDAQVETVVVEGDGDGVAEALLRYVRESGVRSLVLGSASFRWFRR